MTAQPAPVLSTRLEIPVPQPIGRNLLQWEDKHLPQTLSVPALDICEEFTGLHPASEPNRLYYGDNQGALAHLLAQGWAARIRLIYIDPPFDSGLAYARKVRTRGPQRRTVGEAVQYRDIWPGDAYLQFMYERLLLLRPLLAANGVVWLHCDYRQSHRLQLILEEVFGAENYLTTIAWRSQVARGAKVNAFYFPNSTHFIHVFAKDRQADPIWHPPRKRISYTRRQAAAQYMEDERGFFRTSDPGTYSFARLKELHAQGRLYAPYNGEICIDEATETIYCTQGGNIGVKYYLQQDGKNRFSVERAVDNLWDDIPGLGTTPGEDVGYPTQKTEALLARIIATSTDPGDWVLDCFAGSGTTPTVAQRMQRRWIACDLGYGSIQSTRRRLYTLDQTLDQTGDQTDDKTDNTKKHTASEGLPTAQPEFVVYAPAADPHQDAHQQCADHRPVAPASQVPASQVQEKPIESRDITVQIQGPIEGQTTGVHVQIQPAAPDQADWRTWIDTVEIDPAYDGSRFRPRIIDAPANRRDLITGEYTIPCPQMGRTLAIRVTQITGVEKMFLHSLHSTNHLNIY